MLVVDPEGIDRLNEVDPDITLATLGPPPSSSPGKMIATVKIIPFAVSGEACDRAVAVARAAHPLVRLAPYRIKRVGIISTLLLGLADKVIDKTLRVTAERLAPAGARIISERRVPHEAAPLAQAIEAALAEGAELVLEFRRLRHRGSARCHPGGDRSCGRQGRAFRYAGRSW